MKGFGEAPAITYYGVSVEGMQEVLESKRGVIERYALMDPQRFWHFLHHLIPGHHFLIAALDMAGWDLFGHMRRKTVGELLNIPWDGGRVTDYTIGIDTAEQMVEKLKVHPWPVYKIKLGTPHDIDLLRALRAHTTSPFRVDANEGWTFEEAKRLLPDLQQLGVDLVEQPLGKGEWEAMQELKALSPLPLYADESCVEEKDVSRCATAFHGINIKLTKCGGITPAVRMIAEARRLGLGVMMGSMNESSIGTAAIAQLSPLLDHMDADGPLLLSRDLATGLRYEAHKLLISGAPGLGVRLLS